MIDYNLFVACCRNAESAIDDEVLSEAEFERIMRDGTMYHQYSGVSVLFYSSYLGDAVFMVVDGDEDYRFKSYQDYLDTVKSWDC